MNRPGRWLVPVLISTMAPAGSAGADEAWTELLAQMCSACHGPGGTSPGSNPDISQLDSEAMQAFLSGFRDGDIEATVMDRIASALSDSDIEALSQALSENRQAIHGEPGLGK